MKKLKESLTAKIIAVTLAVFFALTSVTSLVAMLVMDENGCYQKSAQQMEEAAFERASQNYSVTAMVKYKNEDQPDELANTNFRYGIIRADSLDNVDLTDASGYVAGDFTDQKLSAQLGGREDLFIHEFYVGDDLSYAYGWNLWDNFFLETNDKVRYFDESQIYAEARYESKMDRYFVISYVQMPLKGAQTLPDGDMFVQARILTELVMRMRYPVIFILIASLLILLASFSFLMCAAGHRSGQEGIRAGGLARVPLDVLFGLLCCVEAAVGLLLVYILDLAGNWLQVRSGFVSCMVVSVCVAVAGILIFTLCCMSFAVNVKLGKWWQRTLLYHIWKKCTQFLCKCLRLCVYAVKTLWNSLTLLWKVWIVLGLLALAEFFVLAALAYNNSIFFFWMLEKLAVYPFFILFLMQMQKLQKGAKRIAGGELDYRIDTGHMFWELKRHGEYLNDIGTGMNRAVNERLKSEHFKTELITNVSHDIKTPLTSIINYVDLLKKEKVENKTAQEYLEVLQRQSARLKKLIEDLMEASKASTGNLNVSMERCDAGVMLVQTVGEFEERLLKDNIELQVRRPQENIMIEADSRHLWRVFDNLMNNICKYAQPMTRAYVNLEQDGERAVVIFRNISKCELNISSEELMERFVRGDSSRNTEGSGLGISIAKSLTELMGGTFTLVVDGDLFKVVLSFPLYHA